MEPENPEVGILERLVVETIVRESGTLRNRNYFQNPQTGALAQAISVC
jgi:hypothetical protein